MDNQTCHLPSSVQAVEKNKVQCEKILRRLFRTKERLDQPLTSFTEEDISELAEQLRTINNAISGLPAEALNEYVRSREIVFQNLQNGIIELNLALNYASPSKDKALFYKHLLSSRESFREIFLHGLSEITDVVSTKTHLALVTDSPRKSSSNYRAMLDFAHDVLPNLYTLFHSTDTIDLEQCQQAISNIKKLATLLERQKAIVNTSLTTFDESDECVLLRCKLGVALVYAGELTFKLIHALSVFQSRCHSRPKQATRFREEIVYYLTLFSRHYDDVLRKTEEMKDFMDQARFLRKSRMSLNDDIVSIG